MESEPNRHARVGGHPVHISERVRRAAWIPAFAGMTLALVFGATSDTALAHTGAEHALSFASGFAHPFTGLDHMLAMVAVGLWAGLNGGRALWAWPAAFVGVMLVGGALGMAGLTLPLVESGILASVVVLGLLVLGAFRLQVAAGAALVALFALLHGHAHGTELSAEGAAVSYSAGLRAGDRGVAYAGSRDCLRGRQRARQARGAQCGRAGGHCRRRAGALLRRHP